MAYAKEFLRNKELSAKLKKAEEIDQIRSRISEREQLLNKLERKGSERAEEWGSEGAGSES